MRQYKDILLEPKNLDPMNPRYIFHLKGFKQLGRVSFDDISPVVLEGNGESTINTALGVEGLIRAEKKGDSIMTEKDMASRLNRLEAEYGIKEPARESLSPAGKKAELAGGMDNEDAMVNRMLGMVGDASYVPEKKILSEYEKAEDNFVNDLVRKVDPFYKGNSEGRV